MLLSPGGPSEGPQGLLWILDEEALVQGSSDSRALDRLCSAFEKEGKAKGESLVSASHVGKGRGSLPFIKGSPNSGALNWLCPTKEGAALPSGCFREDGFGAFPCLSFKWHFTCVLPTSCPIRP